MDGQTLIIVIHSNETELYPVGFNAIFDLPLANQKGVGSSFAGFVLIFWANCFHQHCQRLTLLFVFLKSHSDNSINNKLSSISVLMPTTKSAAKNETASQTTNIETNIQTNRTNSLRLIYAIYTVNY